VIALLIVESHTATSTSRADEPPATVDAVGGGSVDYVESIRPLLDERCVECHGPDEQEGGLRLDSFAGIRTGGNLGASIVPGKSDESLLWRAISGDEGVESMPPDDDSLEADEIELIRHWIDQGAIAPADEIAADANQAASDHWAFQLILRPPLPEVSDIAWPQGAIDRFILARLEHDGIAPSPPADRITSMRRVYLDLVGLPPSPVEVEAYLSDTRADAYERLVDRLLASPHYGERWGRHWLDAARYADSNGFTIDGPRSIWKYRDWVIAALDADMPFDEFVIEQLAGDMLDGATRDQIVASGFHRNTLINEEGGTDDEQFRVASIVDRVNTTGTVFLGLTIGCAECHAHKFDPISQREYYELFAFFNNADEPNIDVPTTEQAAQRDEVNARIGGLQQQLATFEKTALEGLADWEAGLAAEAKAALPDDAKAALAVAAGERDDKQQQAVRGAYLATVAEHQQIANEIAAEKNKLPKIPTTMVMRERDKPRETCIHIRGDFLRRGAVVQPNVPRVLTALLTGAPSPTRLDFARWLVDGRNPLTARVMMNRVWQRYFGLGIVETEDDFGTQGEPPSHAELLDWLSAEFMARDWSLKAMHRLIVTSATYRQSARYRPELEELDPRNRLLARQHRLRLEAEIVRDAALSVSGLLSHKIGGASVFPPQPDGVMELAQVKRSWDKSPGDDSYRRGIYTHFWRSTPYPFLKTFDAPDANTSCTRRTRSNTPLQSLTLLNDEVFNECAGALVDRVFEAMPVADDASRIRHAFRLALGREPNAGELERLHDALVVVTATAEPTDDDPVQSEFDRAAWETIARVLLNLDEFVTRE
jgi:hypothetical protein